MGIEGTMLRETRELELYELYCRDHVQDTVLFWVLEVSINCFKVKLVGML
jgi:hypothetical protein